MKLSFPGIVTAEIVEARFAFSGKISSVTKNTGDKIKQWEWIASLDKKQLQTELDKELLDYERVRAAFDKDHSLQNSLDISIKNVELAKSKLDQVNLISPVEGIIIDNNLRIGLNATPAGNSVKILDTNSYKFEFAITQNDLENFKGPRKILITFFKGSKDDVEAETLVPFMGDKGKFKITAKLSKSDFILPGLEGEAGFI